VISSLIPGRDDRTIFVAVPGTDGNVWLRQKDEVSGS
jgi:hypothetical protein